MGSGLGRAQTVRIGGQRQLHLITGLNIGGAETMLTALLAAGVSMHAPSDVRVVSLSGEGPMAERIRSLGIAVTCLGLNPALPTPHKLKQLLKLVHEWCPDIIQSWMYHSDLLAGWVGSRLGIPVVWGVRRSEFPYLPFSPKKRGQAKARTALVAYVCARMSSRWPARIVCCAEAARVSHVDGGYDESRMLVIRNGIDTRRFAPDIILRIETRKLFGLLDGQIAVGLVARDDPLKDHENFIEAAATIACRFPQARFVLVGRGSNLPQGRIQAAISRSGVADRFIAFGERSDIPAVMNALDIFCLPSISEGFPNVLAEAMACGLPSVATDAGDAAVILGDAASCVQIRDAKALGAALARMLELPAEARQERGRLARQRIESHFAIDAAWRHYQDLYDEVLAAWRRKQEE